MGYHPFIAKFFLKCDEPTWTDMKEILSILSEEKEEEEGKTKSFELFLAIKGYHWETETDYSGGETTTTRVKKETLNEEMKIRNVQCTANFRSLQNDLKSIKSTLEIPQGNAGICISVKNSLQVNYSPELRKYIEDKKNEFQKEYDDFDDTIEVTNHWCYNNEKFEVTDENCEAWLFLSNDKSNIQKLRIIEKCLRLSFFFAPLFDLILGVVVGTLTIPLEYYVDFTRETLIDSSKLKENTKGFDTMIQEIREFMESTTDEKLKDYSKHALTELERIADIYKLPDREEKLSDPEEKARRKISQIRARQLGHRARKELATKHATLLEKIKERAVADGDDEINKNKETYITALTSIGTTSTEDNYKFQYV